MQGLTESRFHMWRVIIALAYGSSVVSPEKQKELRAIFKDVPFNMLQKEQIEVDMAAPRRPDVLLPKVTELRDRRDCIRYVKEIFWQDGLLGGYEQELLKKLEHEVSYDFDIVNMMKGVRPNIDPNDFDLPPKE